MAVRVRRHGGGRLCTKTCNDYTPTVIRTFRYPLRPTKAQEAELDVCLWRCRQIYNAALEQRISAYRRQRKSLTRFDQQKDLTELRRFDPDFGAVAATILRSALKRIELGYGAFFRRL